MAKVKVKATKKKEEPIILVTNDDGFTAPGIHALVEAVKGLGKIVVVAPDKPQSGMGHAITIGEPLRLHKVHNFGDVEAYSCSGTPVDCVKLAVDKVLHRKPDICISGINHGANHSINVIYSGTMSAALEASIESIPSIGFSLLDYSIEADFEGSKKYARIIVEQLLASKKLDKHICLNVNIPKVKTELIKGIKICSQAYAKYQEKFDERKDPHGRKYFWLTGEFVNFDKSKESDVWALKNNYVSVVPVQFDLTNYELKKQLEKKLEILMLFNKDQFGFGLLLGFIAPIFGLFGYYYWKFSLFTLNEFFQVLMLQKSLLSGIISIALIANAIVFTVYINKQKDKTAKGVFIATCVYALISLGFKWFI